MRSHSLSTLSKIFIVSGVHRHLPLQVSVGLKPLHGVVSLLVVEVRKYAVNIDLAFVVAFDFLKEFVCLNTYNYLDGRLFPKHPRDETPVIHHAEGNLFVDDDNNRVLDSLALVILEYYILVVNFIVKFL